MFSGIVEATARLLSVREREQVLEFNVEKPNHFNDLSQGDSVAVDGVCLTVERIAGPGIQFALGPETLKVTGWTLGEVSERVFNLERSLRFGDRVHGHLVTGHVDTTALVRGLERQGETLKITLDLPTAMRPFIWPKGSVALNGVSLTLNEVGDDYFTVGLIPETLSRTNLGLLKLGQSINLEIDNMARGLARLAQIEMKGK